MLDYNIESLFESVYRLERNNNSKPINFVSNWNNDIDGAGQLNAFISEIHQRSMQQSGHYRFAYEQFSLKSQILDFYRTQGGVHFPESNITITPGATQSLNMVCKALKMLAVKRVLVITPTYFATYYALKDSKLHLVFYHLTAYNNYRINGVDLESVICEQFIEAIIMTDPVYSAGIDCPVSDYEAIVAICKKHKVGLVVDFSLGGLSWNCIEDMHVPTKKLELIKQLDMYALVDSLTKRLSLNGIKFSILLGSQSIIDKVDSICEAVYGGLSALQCELIQRIYTSDSVKFINNRYTETLDKVTANFKIVKSTLIDSDFEIVNANSGYFTIINHKNHIIKDILTEAAALYLLEDKHTLALTKDKLSYFIQDKFGFRINLCQDRNQLLLGIKQCIGVDYERFQKRS